LKQSLGRAADSARKPPAKGDKVKAKPAASRSRPTRKRA
jgi:hypothetical protein